MRATSRHTGALVLWVAACAWLAACAAEQPEPPPFGDDSATEDEVSVGPSSANAAGPTTNVTSAAGNTTSGNTSGGNTSGGNTSGGQTTVNPLGGTQTSTVTVGGASTTGGGVTNGGATTGGGVTNGGATTGGGVTNGGAATTGAGPTTGGGFTNGGAAASTTGGGTCTNVRPTGTDWDEATCDQWASETTECDMDWMIDNDYCNESCGRCGAGAAPFGGN